MLTAYAAASLNEDEALTTDQPLYSVAARTKEFIAQHFLVGGDWGRVNELHSYRYRIEARYEGSSLDQYGFLLDITEIYGKLSALVERYEDRTLNELPEFVWSRLMPWVCRICRLWSMRRWRSIAHDAARCAGC